MIRPNTISLLAITLFLATASHLPARTWTDAATKRTLEGDYITSDATHVVIKSGGKSIKIAIARLSGADKTFITEQSATPAAPATTAPLGIVTPPVSIEPLPVEGEGDDRAAGLKVTNNSDKAISKLKVGMALLGEDGSVVKTVPHTSDGIFGERGEVLGKGDDYVIEVSSFWIKENIVSVAGVPKAVTWEDGSQWPVWTGPAPTQEGDNPVSLTMKGVVGESELGLPLIGVFNHSDREIKGVQYQIRCLDGDGKELLKKRWGDSRGGLEAGTGKALVGFEAPPEGTAEVELSLLDVTYQDDPGVATHSALTAEQIAGRDEVAGGNWSVSFEEEHYLGFVLTEFSDDGERTRTYYWSEKPALKHAFHFDHHEDGDEHVVTFSPAKDKGEGSGSSITCRTPRPKISSSSSMYTTDLEFRPAGKHLGSGVHGPIPVYSLEGVRGKVCELMVVFVEDTAAAEEAIDRIYKSR